MAMGENKKMTRKNYEYSDQYNSRSSSMVWYNSMRVDEGRKCLILKMKARTVVGRVGGGGGPAM